IADLSDPSVGRYFQRWGVLVFTAMVRNRGRSGDGATEGDEAAAGSWWGLRKYGCATGGWWWVRVFRWLVELALESRGGGVVAGGFGGWWCEKREDWRGRGKGMQVVAFLAMVGVVHR
ncbi:hypothetical protein HAX54_016568, partial [Datura stramonium]|nr:hypothetical protein [Datura stramonium]